PRRRRHRRPHRRRTRPRPAPHRGGGRRPAATDPRRSLPHAHRTTHGQPVRRRGGLLMTAVLIAPTTSAGPAVTARSLARRTIRKFLRTPQLIVIGTIQGVMFLLIFRYVFGGAIGAGGLDYVEFLVPGFVVTGVLFSGTGAAAGVAEDMEQGFFDRLRSLPIPRTSVLLGRSLADTALVAWGAAITTAIGFAVGFRLSTAWASALAAFALVVVYGFAFTWLFIPLGLFAGNAQAAQGMSLLVFPLTFVSSAYVPVDSMPGWLQGFAEHQPLTPMVD